MKIIKQGDLKRLDKTKRFNCDACGCIWEANQTEYRHDFFMNEPRITCNCPTCGRPTSPFEPGPGDYWENR